MGFVEGVQSCCVNVDEPLLPPEVHLTADFSYFHSMEGKNNLGSIINTASRN